MIAGSAFQAAKRLQTLHPKSRGGSSLSPLGLPKADADSTAILINELHACSF
jgi:hypothetical protein